MSSTGFTVADSPMRTGGARHSCCSRSSVEHQVRTALGAGHRVQLIDDHAAGRAQHLATGVRGQQDVQRLGRRHQDVRRRAAHARALAAGRVAGAHRGPDADVRQAERQQLGANPGERLAQVELDVVRERLERRDVQHVHRILEPALESFLQQRVDRREKRRQRLAGTGRRRDQRVASLDGELPRARLDLGRRAEPTCKPAPDRRVKRTESIAGGTVVGHVTL